MENDNVLIDNLIFACLNGEIIEDYPTSYPLPACLIFGFMQDGRPLHICLSIPPLVKIITAYVPSLDRWEKDWKTKKVTN